MFKKILLVIVVLIAVLAVVIQLQPSSFSVTRTTAIGAPAEKVFELVNDFHNWEKWSPWATLDRAAKSTFSGSPSGNGAIYAWAGNKEVGEGKMTIIASAPFTHIDIELEFIKPFPSTARNDFNFSSEDNGTKVTWTMSGENNFLSKAFCLFMGCMDRMIGPDFEKGLALMKSAAEGH
jgi:uncharacterized protein YndB with AHSA1/START domain